MSHLKKKLAITVIVTVLLVAGCGVYYQHAESIRHTFHITFMNIGQGDSALIQFADGETMLVDCGPNSTVLSRLGRALPVYVNTLDYVLVTHPDLDHYGGCIDVLRHYQVKHIVVNGKEKSDSYFKAWSAAMRGSGAEVTTLEAPAIWTIASSTLQFFSPDDSLPLVSAATDSNNYSIVFRLVASTGKSFMFTGDMEIPLETALLTRYCVVSSTGSCAVLQSKVLKVGHHGSNSSSGEDFLSAVHADQAVLSVGKNTFGHPSLRVIKHVERAGAQILRTDTMGDIVIW